MYQKEINKTFPIIAYVYDTWPITIQGVHE